MIDPFLEDLKALLCGVFNQDFIEQPNTLAFVIGNRPDVSGSTSDLLDAVYKFISNNIERGKSFGNHPLHLIKLSESDLGKLTSSELAKVLLVFFNARPLQDLDALKNSVGFISCIDHRQEKITPDEYLLNYAQNGFFPKTQYQHRYPENTNATVLTLNFFEPRNYKIRRLRTEDFDDLMKIEKSCWAPHLQESSEEIQRRIRCYATESLVVEEAGKVVGVNYAHRIPNLDVLNEGYKKSLVNYQLDDPIVRLISLSVLPTVGASAYGDKLLDFLLYWHSLKSNVALLAGVTRCSDYPRFSEIPFEEYIKQKNKSGFPLDPILQFHAWHGAEIVKLIPSYRPEDIANKGFGILIQYEIKKHKEDQNASKSSRVTLLKSREDIQQIVEDYISRLLRGKKIQNYSLSTPFMDMGSDTNLLVMDSLTLLELTGLLEKRFGIELPDTFFFQYGTVNKIVDYLSDRKLEAFKDWIYNVEWSELTIPLMPLSEENNGKEKGVWVIFADEGNLSILLKEKLETYGHACVLVNIGAYFREENEFTFHVNFKNENDFEKLFTATIFKNGIRGIIYLWGLFEHIPDEPSLEVIQEYIKTSCLGLINLIKKFTIKAFPSTPKLYIGSWSLQEEGDAMSLVQWPLTALSKAISTEHPDFKLQRIALDYRDIKQSVDYLFLELWAKDKEDQIVWRKGKRFGARLIRLECPNASVTEFDQNATYLLIGGFGLGLRLIQWYVEKGARNLVFASPQEYPPGVQEFFDQLKERQITVDVHSNADISNFEFLQRILQKLSKPLKGVIHFATQVDDEQIVKQDWPRFEAILKLKVAASWNLHMLTKDLDLDHFILFSAIGPMLDSRWKANRSMGNAFLDALAHYRCAKHFPAQTINWGPWGNHGLLVKNIVESQIPEGLRLLTPDEGLHVLEHIMKIPLPEVVAAPINWREFFQAHKIDRPLFLNLEKELGLKQSEIAIRLKHARAEERKEILFQYVRMHIRRILQLRATAKLDMDKPFAEMGLTVLKLLDLRNNMQQDLGDQIFLPFNLVREETTIEELSQALAPLLAQTESIVHESLGNEPIAIIGMGCRFPNGVQDPEQFYQFLEEGNDPIREFPEDRRNNIQMPILYGSFLDNIDQFDPRFFGISPREAKFIDPQARILLEVCWESLENAGIAPETLMGSSTGVFVGISTDDYTHLLRETEDEEAYNAYIGTGNFASAVVGRISHVMGLQGPNMAIDTACSSSLVAIHQGVASLQTKESNLVLAGGVQLNLIPDWHIDFAKATMLSPDGHCKTFDASANGYVRGEGCGIVILKRLSDALRDNDNIRAVIRSTAVNQDGRSTGFTVPNRQAQVSLIKKALNKAYVSTADVDYIEAHGTGTILGDPIEVEAIAETYGQNRNEHPLLLGSVKSNIGHLEAAAGVAGLIKVVLSLQHESIPKNLHFQKLNPHIAFKFPAKIVTESMPWPKSSKKRLAGISAFGFSGTNAHAILEEAPEPMFRKTNDLKTPVLKGRVSSIEDEKVEHTVILSAQTEEALEDLIKSYQIFIENHLEIKVEDFAYTTNVGRNLFKHMVAITAHDLNEFLEKLKTRDFISGDVSKADYYKMHPKRKIELPTYPFQRQRYWPQKTMKALLSQDLFFEFSWAKQPPESIKSLKGPLKVVNDQSQLAQKFLENLKNLTGESRGIVYFCDDEKSYESNLKSLLNFIQHIIQKLEAAEEMLPLWFVTRGAQAVLDYSVNLHQASLVGILRTIEHEYPSLKCVHIDLGDDDELENLMQEIAQSGNEPQVAWRNNIRYVARVAKADKKALGASGTLDPKAVYLITGGLGSLGLTMAEFLVSQGAKHLFLTGRKKPSEQALERIEKIAAHIEHRSVDVTDPKAIEKLLSEIQLQGLPLKGIIHAAGSIDNAVLRNQNWDKFASVLAAKAKGAWNLHQKTMEFGIQLDFMIFFSSISSVFGIPGQSNYSSSNAYMDALAHHRKLNGLPALSINWGAWEEEEEGMATKISSIELQNRRFPGILSLTNAQALEAFKTVLSYAKPQIIVVPLNPKELVNLPSTWEKLFTNLLPEKNGSKAILTENRPHFANRQHLVGYLKERLANLLEFPLDAKIDESKGFFDLGMDSLVALEFKNRLQADFGPTFQLPETLVFDYPNIDLLAEFLMKEGTEWTPRIKKAHQAEQIAIIGLGCRFPGGANSPDNFWKLLIEGKDGICPIPPDRWDVEAYFSPEEQPGKITTRQGGFLDSIDQFDADFFGISPREAEFMDPQQRLCLETTWEALERASIVPSSIKGSLTGVFIGVSANDYMTSIIKHGRPQDINAYLASGNALNAITGRLSYFFGLQGPCMAIDAACASSLAAIHEACQSLRQGDCNMAIAGGVNIILSPDFMISLTNAHMLAPDGHCKTFDSKADGYARSEGCGIVILKRMQDALNDKDPILAIIRGSEVNQDGSSSGLTVPNGVAQEQLMRQSLENAQVKAKDVHYIEAHGTGTSLGDPIEVHSIEKVYCKDRDQPLIIGTVKSNIGHLESGAGVAGVIKTVLALRNELIPKNLNFETLNPKINLDSIPAIIASKAIPWPQGKDPRLAAVSAFGFTGTIAHAILEEAPKGMPEAPKEEIHLLTLSAKSKEALEQLVKSYIAYLEEHPAQNFGDVAYTANTGRTHFNWRLGIIAKTNNEAKNLLKTGTFQIVEAPSNELLCEIVNLPIEAIAKRYLEGYQIDWTGYYFSKKYQKILLPTYPFQHQRYWTSISFTDAPKFQREDQVSHLSKLTSSQAAPVLLQRLRDALSSERKEILTEYLQRTIGKILKKPSINTELGLFEAGFNSLMAVELHTQLQSDMGDFFEFPSTLAFDFPSVQKLVLYFEEHILPLIGIKSSNEKMELRKVARAKEPIAIIGIGCRFPGGANQPHVFWDLLKQGYDGITEVPPDRWDINSLYDPDPEAPGKMYVRKGGFLNGSIETFDANFFGISPREAEYMDPQQRLFLEVAWEALENAGINPLSLKDSKTGVFIGLNSHDYSDLIVNSSTLDEINAYLGTGNAASILSGRLSYFLGLKGPSMTVDTACSSSLFSIASAYKSLQLGDCQVAIAGGVNLILSPNNTILGCKAHMLSKDGYCKTFDAQADGYVRGEGCGVVVLKPLSDAMRDQDPILGIVRAAEINQDGATAGLTVPNGESQTDLIRSALDYADLQPDAIDYIETHGTGTSLGDPVEIGSIKNLFSGRDKPLWIGSVKTNIGHLEAAAGVAGMIKTVLALNNETLPAHLHFHQINPRILLESIPARIPLTQTEWLHSDRPRIAGVSSFGFSGTNVHVIVEEPPAMEYEKNVIDRPWHLLTLSAKTPNALDELIDLYAKQLPQADLGDIAFSANTGRAHFLHRLTVIAQTRHELLEQLKTGDYLLGHATSKTPKIAFIFTGQTQEHSELMEISPIFKEAMERSCGLYEYALFALLKSWGIIPDYVAGVELGDIIAAIAAEMISLEEGLKLIASKDNPDEQMKIAKGISFCEPKFGFLSARTGQIISKEGLSADYWKASEDTKEVRVNKLSPSSFPENTLVISAQNNWKELLQMLSQLYLNGIQIDWKAFDKPYYRKKVPLPTYPFQRERYWIDSLQAQKKRLISPQAHPLLGEFIFSPSEEKLFRNELNVDFLPYLKDHQVFDSILFPGAGFVEIMLSAGGVIFKNQAFSLNNLTIEQPLALNAKKPTPIELLAKPKKKGFAASIYSIDEQTWISHATGELSSSEPISNHKIEWENLRITCQKFIDIKALYDQLNISGLHYGKQFQTLRKLWLGTNEVIAELEGESATALIDGSWQALSVLAKEDNSTFLPYSIDRVVSFSEIGTAVRMHGKLTQATNQGFTADIEIFSYEGTLLMLIQGFHAMKTDQTHLRQMLAKQIEHTATAWFYQTSWLPKPLEKLEELKNPWLIVSEKEERIEGLQARWVKFEEAAKTISLDPLRNVLWFASGKDSLKHALNFSQTVAKLQNKPSLYFITHGIQPIGPIKDLDNATFNGFYKTLKLEMPDLDCRHIDLDPEEVFPVKELQAEDHESQVAYYKDIRYVSRLIPESNVKRSGNRLAIPISSRYRLETSSKGSLENLYLKSIAKTSLSPHEIAIEVKATGLNFRDVLNAMGLYPGDPGPLGGECAGIVTEVGKEVMEFKPGDSVFGFASGCFASHIIAPANFFMVKPQSLSFMEAAAIPIVFSTASYALINLAQIKAGDKVLIHAAAGGVGLAAIQIAKLAGAEIYATASSGEKQSYLRALGIEHIYNSRTLAYGEEILRDTKGQGVDIVLNSLSGEGFIAKTVEVCHPNARFVEIGKRNIWTTESMHHIRPDIRYFVLAVDDLLSQQPHEIHSVLQSITERFEQGLLKPLPCTNFDITEAESAFEYLQRAKNIGKVVVSIPEKNLFKIDPAGSYLITGGLGGLGLKMAELLARQGAKHLVLAGRRCTQRIEIPQTKVEAVAVDISQQTDVNALIQRFGSEWPELKGIIHAAGVIDDGILSSQDWNHFEKVFAPKVQGSWNLHKATLNKPLEFFVFFSSIAATFGSPGQINYASANSYMDALACYRRDMGLPALSISWGPWADVGMAAQLTERHRSNGIIALNPDEGIKAFELALIQNSPHVSVTNVDWKLYPYRQTFLSELMETKAAEVPILLQRLQDALTSERKEILTDYLKRSIGKILKNLSINTEIGFFEAGFDSLMAVELRSQLQADLGDFYTFPSTLAFDYPSVQKLVAYFEEHIFPLIGIKAIVPHITKTKFPKKDTLEKDRIAIIGLSCRFPGGANDPEAFWNLLKQGQNGITEIPSDRWDINSFYDPDPDAPGKMYVRRGGFLDGKIDAFDANFFGISPREAEYMDPQQRLILEIAWEALENACINPLSLKGTSAGVFIGSSTHDYSDLLYQLNLNDKDFYATTGNSASILVGRLSYFLELQGPAVAFDTGCSSSIVAIDSAVRSLQEGTCQLALAGGVNLILHPGLTISFCRAGALAPDGHCKSFDKAADGYVRSEGCGMIVLKRLSEAIQDKDPILGIIRATQVNQNGATSGITVPNGEVQAALIRQALAHAELEPDSIDYIEAHGTGTTLGDPIEVGALNSVFSGRKDQPLWLGTVKTNIGHLEAASGIAGVVKVLLALNHEAIPPHLHFKHLNPRISLDDIPAKIPLSLTPWLRSNRPRIAGISSLGFSGNNAHTIIEESPVIEHTKNAIDRSWHILCLSAKTQAALDQLRDLYSHKLPEEELADIAFTTNTGRAHFPYRMVIVSQTKETFLKQLQTGDYLINHIKTKPSDIIFLFTGKTAGDCELMETSPIFKEAMERSQGLYEYAFLELWKSWGIVPNYVAGEGNGDVIAAIAAGIITLEEGLKLIASKDRPEQHMEIAQGISYREPQLGFISSWTGQVIRKEGLVADYWKPHEVIKNVPEGAFVITMQNNWKDLLQTLSRVYLNGIQVDWKAFDKPYARKKVPLPTYPFQRERYWVDGLKIRNRPRLPTNAHPFLGECISLPSGEKLFRNEIDLDLLAFLKDHKVFDSILFSAAGFAEIMLAAGREIFKGYFFTLNNLVIDQPLELDLKSTTSIEIFAKSKEQGYIVSVYHIEDQAWILHAKGELFLEDSISPPKLEWESLRKACQQPVDIEVLYKQFDSTGVHYGKQLQTLRKIWTGNRELIAELEGNSSAVIIEGSLQPLSILTSALVKAENTIFLPYSIDQIVPFAELGNSIRIHAKLIQATEDSMVADVDLFSFDGQPLMKIQGFHARKSDQNRLKQILAKQTSSGAAAWLYQTCWLPQPLKKVKEQGPDSWLIISEKEERIEGLETQTVKPEQALAEIAKNPSTSILWMTFGDDSLKQALSFMQALSKLETKPTFYFITHGIQPIGPITDLQNATFNGFYKSIRLEMPNLNCRHIDLAIDEPFPVAELLAADLEDQVSYYQGLRFVPRLKQIGVSQRPGKANSETLATKQFRIDPKGSYLITGGFSGPGLKTAEWLAGQGAKHLVLIGQVSQEVAIPDAVVETILVDTSQKSAVEALMQKFGTVWPELKGIVHAAGVIDDGILSIQDWSRFEKVFAPKVQGSWNLHEASLNKPLDFFVLFSSIASSLGSPGQINYAAANAYMDALAAFRKDKGLPALSISWGPWIEIDLEANLVEHHRTAGVIELKPEEGIKALELALTQTAPHLLIANIDWRMIAQPSTFLSELVKPKAAETPVLLQRLQEALPSERTDILMDYLQRTVGKILGTASLDDDQGFFEAGMDSLMSEELYEMIQADMGSLHKFPPSLAFDYPSILKLVAYFEDKIFPLIGIKTQSKKVVFTKIMIEEEEAAKISKELAAMDIDDLFDELNKLSE